MTILNVLRVPIIEWDDGVVFIFSWDSRQFFGGFVHLQISLANAIGIAGQIGNITAQAHLQISLANAIGIAGQIGNITAQAQNQVQAVGNPLSWIDTLKYSARENKPVDIVFDDENSTIYTAQSGQLFTIQTLFSIHG
jgi:hypothetical protein